MKNLLAIAVVFAGVFTASVAAAETPITRVHAPSELLLPASVHPAQVHAVITKTFSDRVEGHIVLKTSQVIRFESQPSQPLLAKQPLLALRTE